MKLIFKIILVFSSIFVLGPKNGLTSSIFSEFEDRGQSSEFDNIIRDKNLFSKDPNDVHFYLYSDPRKPNRSREIIIGNVNSLKHINFGEGDVQIFTHGVVSSVSNGGCLQLKLAWLQRGLTNIICVDWGMLSGYKILDRIGLPALLIYPLAIKNTIVVGTQIAKLMDFLLENKVVSNYDRFHLTGHSLGAHISAIAANELKKRKKEILSKITGLDPAGPFYQVIPARYQLDPADAKYVQALHTNTGEFGVDHSVGHVDYYANGGNKQPGCQSTTGIPNPLSSIICNHLRAVFDYARIISGEDMIGCPCKNGTLQNPLVGILQRNQVCKKRNKCNQKHLFTLHSTTTGNYYLIVPSKAGDNNVTSPAL